MNRSASVSNSFIEMQIQISREIQLQIQKRNTNYGLSCCMGAIILNTQGVHCQRVMGLKCSDMEQVLSEGIKYAFFCEERMSS